MEDSSFFQIRLSLAISLLKMLEDDLEFGRMDLTFASTDMDTDPSTLLNRLTEEEWTANLDSLPYDKLTKVFSDLELIKDGPARTTSHIYLAFKYLLTQRLWDLSIWSNPETFWTYFKKRISSPEHRCVRFMMITKKRFLQMMEREMFDTGCEAWNQAISMGYNLGTDITRQLPPTIPGYDENHPDFNDVILTFNGWSMVEERGDECLRTIFEEQAGRLQDSQGDGIRELAAAVSFRQRRMSDPGVTSNLLLAKTDSLGLRRATTSAEIGWPVEQTASNYIQATPQGEDIDMHDAETVVHRRSMLDGAWVAAPVPNQIQTFNFVTSRKRVADFDLSDASPNEACRPTEDIEMGDLVDEPQCEERAAKRRKMNGSRTSLSFLYPIRQPHCSTFADVTI